MNSLQATGLSDIGAVRTHNEDAFAVLQRQGLILVSDGMGGHSGGRFASAEVVENVSRLVRSRLANDGPTGHDATRDTLRNAIAEVNLRIWDIGRNQSHLAGMGATLVLAFFREKHVFIANMGDSRAYLYRNGRLTVLTEDHSVVGLLLREGAISSEQAKDHPAKGQLSRYMGMGGNVFPDVTSLPLISGDRFLLCSDGLHTDLSDTAIQRIFDRRGGLEETCRRLVQAALEAGGSDNVTAITAEWRDSAVVDRQG